MVTLSGYVSHQSLIRVPAVASFEAETPVAVSPDFPTEPIAVTGPSGSGLTLQTCVLRC
jgi:hypothetical protein